MATIVADCPRCDAQKMTCDVIADVCVGADFGWAHKYEITGLCRRCHRPSLFKVKLHNYDLRAQFGKNGQVTGIREDIAFAFKLIGNVSIADLAYSSAPQSLPTNIQAAFEEGTRCLAIGCYNAAGGMFRLCLDLATKELLASSHCVNSPNKQLKRNLAPRLRWLFDEKVLPLDLKELSSAVKENGDDGAHEGSLTSEDAEDLYDFSYALLDRLYAEPAKLAAMADRKRLRREEASKR